MGSLGLLNLVENKWQVAINDSVDRVYTKELFTWIRMLQHYCIVPVLV